MIYRTNFCDFNYSIEVKEGITLTYLFTSHNGVEVTKNVLLYELENSRRNEVIRNLAYICISNNLDFFFMEDKDIKLEDIKVNLDIEASSNGRYMYYDTFCPGINYNDYIVFVAFAQKEDEENDYIEFIAINPKGEDLTIPLFFK